VRHPKTRRKVTCATPQHAAPGGTAPCSGSGICFPHARLHRRHAPVASACANGAFERAPALRSETCEFDHFADRCESTAVNEQVSNPLLHRVDTDAVPRRVDRCKPTAMDESLTDRGERDKTGPLKRRAHVTITNAHMYDQCEGRQWRSRFVQVTRGA
jgi:hypothetical protein